MVDVSGSMDEENRLGLVKRALGLLLDELRRRTGSGSSSTAPAASVLLEPHQRSRARSATAIDRLRPEGSTNAEDGLRLGYDLAGGASAPGAINRVILCSDGVANVGATGPEAILARIGARRGRGIELTTVGFGMGNYNDVLMEQLADKGDGHYAYVDTLDEAQRVFVENLTGTLADRSPRTPRCRSSSIPRRSSAIGCSATRTATSPTATSATTRSTPARSAPATRRPRSTRSGSRRAPARNEHHRHAAAALEERRTGNVEEAALTLRVRDLERHFDVASRNLRRAAVAAELAEILKQSFYAKEASWRTLRAEADRLERISAPAQRRTRWSR